MNTGRMVIIKRIKAKRGYKHDTFVVYSAPANTDVLKTFNVESKMKEIFTLTYENSTMIFKLKESVSKMTEYQKNKISSVLAAKEFIDGLLKFKYDDKLSEVTVYLSNMPNSLVADIEYAWGNF